MDWHERENSRVEQAHCNGHDEARGIMDCQDGIFFLTTIGDKPAMECKRKVKVAYEYLQMVSATGLSSRKIPRSWFMKLSPKKLKMPTATTSSIR